MTIRDSIMAARRAVAPAGADGVQRFEFRFDGSDPTFAGHFPGRAILPGIFQVEMARLAAEWSGGCRFAIQEIGRAKFQRPVLPGESLQLQLKLTGAGHSFSAQARFFVQGQPAGETLLKLCPCD